MGEARINPSVQQETSIMKPEGEGDKTIGTRKGANTASVGRMKPADGLPSTPADTMRRASTTALGVVASGPRSASFTSLSESHLVTRQGTLETSPELPPSPSLVRQNARIEAEKNVERESLEGAFQDPQLSKLIPKNSEGMLYSFIANKTKDLRDAEVLAKKMLGQIEKVLEDPSFSQENVPDSKRQIDPKNFLSIAVEKECVELVEFIKEAHVQPLREAFQDPQLSELIPKNSADEVNRFIASKTKDPREAEALAKKMLGQIQDARTLSLHYQQNPQVFFSQAVRAGHVELVEFLCSLEKEYVRTPGILSNAILKNRSYSELTEDQKKNIFIMTKILLEAGADVNSFIVSDSAIDIVQPSPLMAAIYTQDKTLINLIINNQNINLTKDHQESPLKTAIETKNPQTVKFIFDQLQELHADKFSSLIKSNSDKSSLLKAAIKTNNPQIVTFLFEKLDFSSLKNKKSIFLLAKKNKNQEIQKLVNEKLKINRLQRFIWSL